MDNTNLFVALDIGTSKVTCLVASGNADGTLEVAGVGTSPSKGLKRGVVIDIEQASQSIRRAIENAELVVGCKIHSVTVGISGDHIVSKNSTGSLRLRDEEVTEADLIDVTEAAHVQLQAGKRLLHVLPREYRIDGQKGIREPLGMSGTRLEVSVHLVMAGESAVSNLEKCIHACGLSIDAIVLSQLASNYAVMDESERELGGCLVDIGGGTCDIAVYKAGAICHTGVVSIAGEYVTRDIAVSLRTPIASAEDVKLRYACALRQMTEPGEMIRVPGIGNRPVHQVPREQLAKVVEYRYEEIFELIKAHLDHHGFTHDVLEAGGMVLTGGASGVEGAADLAEEILHLSVRVASPKDIKGVIGIAELPSHATAVGLLLYAKYNESAGIERWSEPEKADLVPRSGIVDRMRGWIKDQF